jgi:hypothetical protein
VRFFAVDIAGNEEAPKSETYTIDRAGPAPVTGLLAATSATIDLTWTNPADTDFAGVLVLRREGLDVFAEPEDGTASTVGEALGDGEVAFVGNAAAFQDADLPEAQSRYAVYAFDALNNYSPVARTGAGTPFGDGGMTIEVTLAGVVTVTNAPDNVTVTGTANLVVNTLTVDLTISPVSCSTRRSSWTRLTRARSTTPTAPCSGPLGSSTTDQRHWISRPRQLARSRSRACPGPSIRS